MAKTLTLELTVAQAQALRTMCLSSDNIHSDDEAEFTNVMRRALGKLEAAIEQAKGTVFVHRYGLHESEREKLP